MTNYVRSKAYKVRKQIKGEITYKNLCEFAKSKGIAVVYYSSSEKLLKHLGIENLAQNSHSFIYINDTELLKVIFIDDRYNDKLFLLAHELGHYFLNHEAKCTVEDENNANEFARLLLKKRLNKPFIAALSAVVIICTAFAFYLGDDKDAGQAPHQQQQIQQEEQKIINDEVGQIYIVTRTGDKYHLPDCQYVRNKTNTLEITLDKAISMGYEPCKICIEK